MSKRQKQEDTCIKGALQSKAKAAKQKGSWGRKLG
jgi:hypothetical protein